MRTATSDDIEEAVEIEDEDDYTGCFLEPTANSVNMVERVAEANRKLYEDESSDDETPDRPKKVQFSESLINFEPETYDSEEFENSEDGGDKPEEINGSVGRRRERPKTARWETKELRDGEEVAEEIKREPVILEEIEEEEGQEAKVLLVMLRREQSSSCESIIGEEISDETKPESDCPKEEEAEVPEVGKPEKVNLSLCKVSKTTLDVKCSPEGNEERRRVRVGSKSKKAKGANDPIEGRGNAEGVCTEERLDRRSCCMVRTDLPKYNGLRSEYGLSAEQLQERKRKTTELRQQRQAMRMKKRQEEIRRKMENEESFTQWLSSKRKGKTLKRPTQVDTLSRSDVYIQAHAVYASRSGVFYSVESGLSRKKHSKTPRMVVAEEKPEQSINLGRLFDNVSPHVNHTYRIYIGRRNK